MWDGVADHWGRGEYRDIPWSKFVLLGRQRHINDLKRAERKDPDFPYYFDEKAADHAVWFISKLRHFEGAWAGKPFILSDWQEWDIVRPLFGWKRLDGTRRFRNAYVEIARKNGKSALAAAIAAYMLIADREWAAQVICCATKEEQARIVWNAAKRMIELSPELRHEMKAFKTALFNAHLGSTFKPLGRDSKSQDGLNVHCGIIDEYHAHKTSELRDVVAEARGARRQPLLFIITTAGFGTSTPCKKESDLVKRILDGTLKNDSYFVFVATVDDPEKWNDPIEWVKANPNMGITLYEEQFRVEFQEAEQSPSKQNSFKCKKLNIWVEQATRWISMARYAQCDGEIDWSKFLGKRAFCGLDLGITRDLSAFCLAFLGEEKPEPYVYLKMKYWIPEEGKYIKMLRDGVNYPEWADLGFMTTTPGETTRYDIVRRDINEEAQKFEIAEIAVDRAHAHQLMVDLADDGLNIVKHAQTMMAMAFPCRSLEELILSKRLRHGNDPVLRWMMSNVSIVRDGNDNMKIMKDKSGDRVDGVVAAAMAIGRLLIAPEPVNFVYNLRGIYAG